MLLLIRCLLPIMILLCMTAAAEERSLFDLERLDPAVPVCRDVKVSTRKGVDGTVLRAEFGHKTKWPGFDLRAPEGKWDFSRQAYLALDVRNTGTVAATLNCRVDNPGANGRENCNTGSLQLEPGTAGTLTVTFQRKASCP